ncbi:MAG: hypothetical protein ACJ0TD_06125 [Arenicellales bacterium]|nr:MAG: hypothetical protein CBC21_12380 [Proteobacteria bacterium TMED61]RZO16752.1 MAG: hypothetical protein EVB04_02185 [Candidatus Thioglobus sp.]|tara:strand:+ start:4827 stop:5408 length:582 start_codon:yes stop_codon:yes gene_type:complete
MSKIAVIGFGSLLWDLDDLAPKVSGEWKMYEGPILPLEFSLVSRKRHYALALVIDYGDGAPCPTCVIDSVRSEIGAAIVDLANRERMEPTNIGFVDRNTGASHSHREETRNTFWNWIEDSTYDGAVWTDGERNFEALTGRAFSLKTAQDHLRSLQGISLEEARRYIRNAPARVETPLRRALEGAPWWHNDPKS